MWKHVRTPINPLEGLKLVARRILHPGRPVRTPINPLEGLKPVTNFWAACTAMVRTPINPLRWTPLSRWREG